MTPDQLSLLQTIITNPGDDAPRLVYADWLEENGQEERAELIRVQCELARIETPVFRKITGEDASTIPDPLVVRFSDLSRRERELLDWLDVDLLPILHGYTRSNMTRAGEFLGFGWFESERKELSDDITVSFSRGFISSLTCTAETFLRIAPLLVWREGERETCPECAGTRGYCEPGGLSNGGDRGIDCPRCEGHGTAPRPMPETVQPVERVKLTTEPDEREFGTVRAVDWVDRTAKYFRWPGIVFELPERYSFEGQPLTAEQVNAPDFGQAR